jgi:hypothetical protein
MNICFLGRVLVGHVRGPGPKRTTINQHTLAEDALLIDLDIPEALSGDHNREGCPAAELRRSLSPADHLVNVMITTTHHLRTCERVIATLDAEMVSAIANLENSTLLDTARAKGEREDPRWGWAFHLVPQVYEYALVCDALREALSPYRQLLQAQGVDPPYFTLPPITNAPIEWKVGRPCPWEDLQARFNLMEAGEG